MFKMPIHHPFILRILLNYDKLLIYICKKIVLNLILSNKENYLTIIIIAAKNQAKKLSPYPSILRELGENKE
jgi:hypothetical protein